MKIKSTIKEINKLFDERYHGVMRAWRDKGFVLDLGKDIKSFYTQQILSLIEEHLDK